MMNRTPCILAALAFLLPLGGCGGGQGRAAPDRTLTFGNVVLRASGTMQPPVTEGEAGAVVTGIAGGAVSSLVFAGNLAGVAAGSRIAFESARNGRSQLFLMNTDGSGQLPLTGLTSDAKNATWSPDATQIAYASNGDGGFEIYVTRAQVGGATTQLTRNSADAMEPAWSPDGSLLAYTSNQSGSKEIYVMNADGSGTPRQLTNSSHTTNSNHPAWSPDGAQIAFSSDRSGVAQLYIMNADGSNPQRLTTGAMPDSEPSWSSDGLWIAFQRGGQIYVVLADGGPARRLTNDSATDSAPSWSTDSAQIAFTSTRDGNPEIYSMDASGDNQTRLTKNSALDGHAAWSPIPQSRILIGTGGLLADSAAGFLFSRAYDTVASFVVFDAANRTLARVAPQTGQGGEKPDIVFAVTAETSSLTRLAYLNASSTSPTLVLGPGTKIPTASGALVDFGSDGTVANVLPYNSGKAVAGRATAWTAPTIETRNGVHLFRGDFLGVWNAAGRNLAPRGAKEVRTDAASGAVLSVQ